jgi:hypothetical protein
MEAENSYFEKERYNKKIKMLSYHLKASVTVRALLVFTNPNMHVLGMYCVS